MLLEYATNPMEDQAHIVPSIKWKILLSLQTIFYLRLIAQTMMQ